MTKQQNEKLQEIKDQIQRVQIYGIYHDGELVYIGATRSPLGVRLTRHVSAAGRRAGPFARYMDDRGLRVVDLEIKELTQYDTEEEALARHIEHTYNAQLTTKPPRRLDYDDVPDEALLRIGKEPDLTIADGYDCPLYKIRNARAKMGISSGYDRGYTHIEWDQWDDQLGTMTDADMAAMIGCSPMTVYQRRKKLGIEAHHGRIPDAKRREMADEYMATDKTLSEVADEYGVCTAMVGRAKKEHYGARPQAEPTPVPVRMAAAETYATTSKTQREVADEYGISKSVVTRAHAKYNK